MSTGPTFGTQIIGQTEKALNAILARLLAGTGLTEPQWVTLTITAGALKVSEAQAQARITELAAAQLVDAPNGEGSPVKVTDAGQRLYAQIRTAVTTITERLWGDLPAEELATTARVLSVILERANAELAGA
jgi:hypothetical protein